MEINTILTHPPIASINIINTDILEHKRQLLNKPHFLFSVIMKLTNGGRVIVIPLHVFYNSQKWFFDLYAQLEKLIESTDWGKEHQFSKGETGLSYSSGTLFIWNITNSSILKSLEDVIRSFIPMAFHFFSELEGFCCTFEGDAMLNDLFRSPILPCEVSRPLFSTNHQVEWKVSLEEVR